VSAKTKAWFDGFVAALAEEAMELRSSHVTGSALSDVPIGDPPDCC
jgi:hypothetical protein